MDETNKAYVICVDSDGCVIDCMTTKHVVCFGPSMIDTYEVWAYEKELLAYWMHINLYSKTRGINRFIGLKKLLEYAKDKQYIAMDIEPFKEWVETTGELSNQSLEKQLIKCNEDNRETKSLEKALAWSNDTNKRIKMLGSEEKKVFKEAIKSLRYIKQYAAIAVISSANRKAIQEEWEAAGLLDQVDYMYTQEQGSKEDCLKDLIKKGYNKHCMLMIGDSPGDLKAAKNIGVGYYPIAPKEENKSWQVFREKYLSLFVKGLYTKEQMDACEVLYDKSLSLEN